MMYWYNDHMNGWGYGLMTISMIFFWGLIIFAVVALVRYLGRPNQQTPPAPPVQPQKPEELLAERFARGEIDEQDYQQRLDVLRSSRQPLPKP